MKKGQIRDPVSYTHLDVYKRQPEGITSSNADEYDFDLFHFTGMHREYERGQDEAQELVDQAAANINNHGDYDISNDTVALMVEDIELTDHGIQFIVDQDAFLSLIHI